MNQKNYLNTRKIYQKTKIKIDQRAVLYHVPGALNCKGNIHARKSQINPHSQNKNQAHGIPTTYRIKVLTYIHVSYIASASKRIISTREKLNLYEYNRRLLHLPKKKTATILTPNTQPYTKPSHPKYASNPVSAPAPASAPSRHPPPFSYANPHPFRIRPNLPSKKP